MGLSSYPVLLVMAIAVASSLLAEIRIGSLRVPMVVWEMVFGIIIGPHALGLARVDGLLGWLGGVVGLGALFFMTGMDLDLQKVRGRPPALAIRGWTVSLGLGLCAGALLHAIPTINVPVVVGLALTTTSMGTFMPILRDSGALDTKFGSLVLAAAATGEFGPVIVVSLLLTHKFGAWQELVLTIGFIVLAFAAALIALGLRPPRILALFERSMNSSTQLPVCVSLLLLAGLDVLSERVGLEAVLGAFAAGMIVSLATGGSAGQAFRGKMKAICFGFFVPFFFVVSGMEFDLGALLHSSKAILLMPLFLILFLLVRGIPVFLYKPQDLAKNERWPFVLYSSTALSMVVAIVSIEVRLGRMTADVGAALAGAGLLSVLLFPMIAGALRSRLPNTSASEAEA